jgi:hypothetical protein
MMDKVESLFSEQFTSNDRCEALTYLKATQKKSNWLLIFLLGTYYFPHKIPLIIFKFYSAMHILLRIKKVSFLSFCYESVLDSLDEESYSVILRNKISK